LPDLGAYDEPVKFDWEGAKRLSAELRATATLLEDQVQPRNTYAAAARKDWKGKFADAFDGRMRLCTSDAKHLAGALRSTALKVDELATRARAEQQRRDLAKEYVRKHDEWQRKRDERGDVHKVWDGFTEGVGLADSDEPKPPDPPEDPKRYTGDPPPTPTRASSW
jgi:hypothetical protein